MSRLPLSRLVLVLSLAGCTTEPKTNENIDPDAKDEQARPDGSDGSDGSDSGASDTGEPALECDSLPAPPYTPEKLRGFTRSEDFVFDAEGHIISIDNSGNLVRQSHGGAKEVMVPRVGEVAGMGMLPNGDIVLAQVERGAVQRITADGSTFNLATGIDYPNGITVDSAGMVYVSEHIRGRIRQIDPETETSTIIATGLVYPNGLAFSPDESVLYVNSFGGGTVHAIERGADGFSAASTISTVDSGPEYIDPCETLDLGAECGLESGGLGACTDAGCTENPDLTACEGLSVGDACTTSRGGAPFESVCSEAGTDLVCPRIPASLVEPCRGSDPWAECDPGAGDFGWCDPTWEGVLACQDYFALTDQMSEACSEAERGDPCSVDMPAAPFVAACEAGSVIGLSGLVCAGGPLFYGVYGGLDGLDVDACGNVYVTEFVTGLVYRVPPEGGVAEPVISIESGWIPNLHWGSGVGGWSRELLYVMDRDDDSVHAVDVGIHGRDLAHLP